MEPTQEELKKILHYDESTGIFTRIKTKCGRIKTGSVAGNVRKDGRVKIGVGTKAHYAHRLAWIYVYGESADGHIDHINGNNNDNRISNLRVVSASENMQNQRRARSDSAYGFLGVSKDKTRWMARIKTNGKQQFVGSFSTPEEAHAAYIEAKRKIHSTCSI